VESQGYGISGFFQSELNSSDTGKPYTLSLHCSSAEDPDMHSISLKNIANNLTCFDMGLLQELTSSELIFLEVVDIA